MGTIVHGDAVVHLEDRLLAHLQVVIVQKFRRNEAFLVSWLDPASDGDGRSALWLTPNMPVYFKFAGSRVPRMNESWVRTLHASANSSTGLILTTESGEMAHSAGVVIRTATR